MYNPADAERQTAARCDVLVIGGGMAAAWAAIAATRAESIPPESPIRTF